jgi:hypothetical protein
VFAEVLVGYESPESNVEFSNDSDILGARGDRVTMSINDKSIDQEKELVTFFLFHFASESSRRFSIDTEHALGKDESEDLVKGEWFTVDLASQTNRKESDGFQCLDDAKDLHIISYLQSGHIPFPDQEEG